VAKVHHPHGAGGSAGCGADAGGEEVGATLYPGPGAPGVPVGEVVARALALVLVELEATTVEPQRGGGVVLGVHEQEPVAATEVVEALPVHELLLGGRAAKQALLGEFLVDLEELLVGGLLDEVHGAVGGGGDHQGAVAVNRDAQRLAPVAAA